MSTASIDSRPGIDTSPGIGSSHLKSTDRVAAGQRRRRLPLEQLAQQLLETHPHFRGRARFVSCRRVGNRLYLDGCLPSYYLKQLAQEAVRELEDCLQIENRITVSSPIGEVIDPGFGDDSEMEVARTCPTHLRRCWPR